MVFIDRSSQCSLQRHAAVVSSYQRLAVCSRILYTNSYSVSPLLLSLCCSDWLHLSGHCLWVSGIRSMYSTQYVMCTAIWMHRHRQRMHRPTTSREIDLIFFFQGSTLRHKPLSWASSIINFYSFFLFNSLSLLLQLPASFLPSFGSTKLTKLLPVRKKLLTAHYTTKLASHLLSDRERNCTRASLLLQTYWSYIRIKLLTSLTERPFR